MNESLLATVLHLLNHPHTRRFVRADVELEQILAPYTDFHYRLTAEVGEEQLKGLLDVISDLFLLDVPVETTDFTEAMISVGGPNLMDNYLAFLLGAFIHSRLLEANSILPHSHSHHLHCLPSLVHMAASPDIPRAHRQQASAAVTHLKRLHERKRRGPSPHGLYLDHVLRKTSAAAPPHGYLDVHHRHHQRDVFPMKESDEALLGNLRDSHVLHHDENRDWNWELVQTILKVAQSV
ncbi:hypothetical protein CRUP_028371 [Coryphaenoides rupestris]|nr:hypothetical protein CRUP_028371 [Coryphaenoides rupestris]